MNPPENQIITSKLAAVKSLKTKTKTKTIKKTIEVVSEITPVDDENEIINFELKTIQAPLLHQNTKKWIIFSDLHVRR